MPVAAKLFTRAMAKLLILQVENCLIVRDSLPIALLVVVCKKQTKDQCPVSVRYQCQQSYDRNPSKSSKMIHFHEPRH